MLYKFAKFYLIYQLIVCTHAILNAFPNPAISYVVQVVLTLSALVYLAVKCRLDFDKKYKNSTVEEEDFDPID